MPAQRKKFATQMDEFLLEELRAFAKSDGRQIQTVLETAVAEYLQRERKATMRPKVAKAFEYSLRKYPKTYEMLSK